MEIRKYMPCDCIHIAKLFYDTVHTINAKDYTKEQLNAWATGTVDLLFRQLLLKRGLCLYTI